MSRAQHFDRHVACKGHTCQHNSDQPDFARFHSAERTDRIVGNNGERNKGHGEQDQRAAEFALLHLLQPVMQRCTQRQNANGCNRGRRCGAHVPDHGVGRQRKGQHPGNGGSRRIIPVGEILVPAHDRECYRKADETQAENDAAGHGQRCPRGFRDHADGAAEKSDDREGADAGGSAACFVFARTPSALDADQEADAESHRKMRHQILDIHVVM